VSPPSSRKSWGTVFLISAVAVITLYLSFQKAVGDTITNFAMAQLGLTNADLQLGENTSSITVDAIDLSNSPVQGVWATIHSSEGSILGSGYTPFTLSANGFSTGYNITVTDFDGKTFQYWQDDRNVERTRIINVLPTGENATITAVYDTGDALRGFTPLTYANEEEQIPDLTLQAVTVNGIEIEGLYAIIDRQQENASGTTYKAYVGDFQDKVFDHWEDTESTDRERTLTTEEDTIVTAVYRTEEQGCNPALSNPRVNIQDPISGQEINEATYEISGFAGGSDGCEVDNVYVRILGADGAGDVIADYQPVSDISPPEGPAWSDWTYQYEFLVNGNYTIEAKVIDASGNSKVHSVPISVDFSESALEESPAIDTIKPTITITSPADGAVLTGHLSGINVDLSGTATDELGELENVWVRVDRGAYRAVTPEALGDWSTWTHAVNITTEGTHEITAKASDTSENPQWDTINVTILFTP
jgi:hypothetical protein